MTSIAVFGSVIGACLGLALTQELDHPGSLVQMARDASPDAFIARRQAQRDARVPLGGFRSCAQAKAAGFGQVWRGEKAYSPSLDRDGDGRACEWNAGILNWR